mmetsp:Transcript_37302/g.60652  ORF Transcript_37302/g.60652 Transcript_37302/m.60652 type:complete len:93 (+) Transcript_37302:120-398(+)
MLVKRAKDFSGSSLLVERGRDFSGKTEDGSSSQRSRLTIAAIFRLNSCTRERRMNTMYNVVSDMVTYQMPKDRWAAPMLLYGEWGSHGCTYM